MTLDEEPYTGSGYHIIHWSTQWKINIRLYFLIDLNLTKTTLLGSVAERARVFLRIRFRLAKTPEIYVNTG